MVYDADITLIILHLAQDSYGVERLSNLELNYIRLKTVAVSEADM